MKQYLCNPLNLEYRLQIKQADGHRAVFREAADPTLRLFKGVYYLFVSMSGGFWYSDDLHAWRFHETPELPVYDYAPDVCEIKGKMVFSASRGGQPCSLYVSADPVNQPFTPAATLFPFWDPALFADDDGRVYLYWGCGNTDPLYGIELDADTFAPMGERAVLFGADEHTHGWERSGPTNPGRPYLEGAFMNKHRGRYYLQYAAPGTEFNVYSDGVYVADAPLGPFTYQPHNPFSSKPGGFAPAAGHGSTFFDKAGNGWHIATMRISVNEMFERRLGLFPCAFDADGTMYCNQHFADYPFALGQRTDMARTAPDFHLFAKGVKASASSSQAGYAPEKGIEEDICTWWAADKNDPDPWFEVDLGAAKAVHAVQINFAEHDMQAPAGWDRDLDANGYKREIIQPQATAYVLAGSADGNAWEKLRQGAGDYTHDLVCFDAAKRLRYLRVSHIQLAMDGAAAISGLRVFGLGDGPPPGAVTAVTAQPRGDMDVQLAWDIAPGADGYNVRYGLAPDKLYNSWQLWGENALLFPFKDKGQRYYLAVDSFNENGVTAGTVIKI